MKSADSRYLLTKGGIEYVSKTTPERNETLCKLMLRLSLFNEALSLILLDKDKKLTRAQIMDMIRARGCGGTTVGRRSRTTLAWFEWMERTFGLVEVRGGQVSLLTPQTRLDT